MKLVAWNDTLAHYSDDEQAEMAALRAAGASRDELALIHGLKALLGATIVPWREPPDPDFDANAYAESFTASPDLENEKAPTRRGRAGAVGADQGSVFD